MALYLGILIFSFIVTSIAIVPFIDFLYKRKTGIPIGGGILIVSLVTLLYTLLFPLITRLGVYITSAFPIKEELNIIFFTFISFGLLGFYDDIIKIFGITKTNLFGLRIRHKLVIQILLSTTIASMLFINLRIHIINIPNIGILNLGWLYIPLATILITAFTNAFDVVDGLDGLSCGVLLICLLAFWALAVASMDTPLSIFIALWIGSLTAFLYFNVYPARIRLGNAGGLAFGATLAVVGLLLGKTIALLVIGGIFAVEGGSSLLQFMSRKLFNHKLFQSAPLHNLLRARGWEEPKIVMRAWLAGIILAVFGLWLAQL